MDQQRTLVRARDQPVLTQGLAHVVDVIVAALVITAAMFIATLGTRPWDGDSE